MKIILVLIINVTLFISVCSQTSIDNDIFIFGRDNMPTNSGLATGNFFFFNRITGALRGGILIDSKNWAPDSLGLASIAIGYNTKAIGGGAIALGNETTSKGSGATALGKMTIASGDDGSTALGYFSKASGNIGATALGYSTTSSGGNGATALGYSTTSSGSNGATALGYSTTSSGHYGATALGKYTVASGSDGATALGIGTIASGGIGATAIGNGTKATGNSCTVVGMYNDSIVSTGTSITSTSPLFIVGNGEVNMPSNALEVYKNGNATISGALNFRSSTENITTDNQLVTIGSRGYIRISSDDSSASQRTVNLSNGNKIGQILILEGASLNKWQLIDDNGTIKLDLSADHDFGLGDTIQLLWNGTAWLEIHYSDN